MAAIDGVGAVEPRVLGDALIDLAGTELSVQSPATTRHDPIRVRLA